MNSKQSFNFVVWMFTGVAFVLGWLLQWLPFWLILLIAFVPIAGSMRLWYNALKKKEEST